MDIKKILKERTTTSFGISIGTGLMLESLFDPTKERYDKERVIPTRVNLNRYNGWIINVHTLIRNLLGSLTTKILLEDISSKDLELIVKEIITELYVIKSLCMSTNVSDNYISVLIPNYTKLLKKLNSNKDVSKIKYIQNNLKAIELFSKYLDKVNKVVTTIDNTIDKSKLENVIITSHYCTDLLISNNMVLLESHTGVLKQNYEMYTKYSKSSNLDYSRLPMLDIILHIVGDNTLVSGMSPKIKKQLVELSTSCKWTYRTTREKVLYDLDKDKELKTIKDNFLKE